MPPGFLFLALLLATIALPLPLGGQDTVPGERAGPPEPVVHAVLFYSPTCPHCHQVITEYLVPLQEEYGRRLVILGLDTSQGWANEIYWAALRHYEVPQRDWAVPLMIVENEVLVGGDEIPARLPEYLERGLAGEGIDLPDLPALLEVLEEQNVLDPRYPDRRIVAQAPDSEEEEPTGAGEEDVASSPDEVPAEPDTGAKAPRGSDSARTPADTVPAPETGPDTRTEVEDTAGAAAGKTGPGPDTATGRRTAEAGAEEALPKAAEAHTPSAVEAGEERKRKVPPSDSTKAAGDPEPGALGAPGAPGGPGGPESPEAGGDVPPGSAEAEGASPSRPRGGPLGMADAARELSSLSMGDRFMQDPTANSLSVLVLLALLASVVLRGYPPRVRGQVWPPWIVPLLVIFGLGVASYLSYIEVSRVEAVCGPVGDCNTVNQSEYARLFGVLPVGVLGMGGYVAILALWALARFASREIRSPAALGLWGAALFGTVFSIYLTFLEPFVIGATCAWCLSSSVIMMLLLWASAPLAARAWPGRREAVG